MSEEFPVFAVDLRGHGRSDWPGTYSIELFAHDVCGALEQLQVGPVHLVGHSLGGLVACKVAAAVPDLVRTLVLEDVGMPHPRVARPTGGAARIRLGCRRAGATGDRQSGAVVGRRDHAHRRTHSGHRRGATQLCAPAAPGRTHQQLADARLVTIDAGHLLHKHEPGEFIQNLLDFLAAHRAH